MFQKREYAKRSSFLPLTLLRLILSLAIFGIFFLGLYQAFKYFTGTDPLQIEPHKLAAAVLSLNYEEVANIKSTDDLKRVLGQVKEDVGDIQTEKPQEESSNNKKKERILRFAIVSDSHEDNENLAKAVSNARDAEAKFIIGLGDHSKVGAADELETVKRVFNDSDMPYYLTAGDHDLWVSRDKKLAASEYFQQVFGSPYQSFADTNIRFVLVYNSDNYLGIDTLQWSWLEDELGRINQSKPLQTFVFMHEPLYHPTSDHVMGKGDSNQEGSPQVAKQAEDLINLLSSSGVGVVIAGDTHFFTEYSAPDSGLKMVTVGAVTRAPNAQAPRFALVDVFTDGSYNVGDLEIK